MKNTLLEKLKELPEPYRSQAIENYDPEFCPRFWKVSGKYLIDAVTYGFDWEKTPKDQGYDYWSDFITNLRFPTLKTPEPTYKRTPVVWTEKDGVHSSCVGEVMNFTLKGEFAYSNEFGFHGFNKSLEEAKQILEDFATKAINQYMEKI